MVSADALLGFTAAAFLLIVVPGPSVLFVISRGVALGRRAALVTVAGNALGIYLQVLAVAIGLGAVVERSVVALEVLKLAGAIYLIYLGIQALRQRRELATVLDAAGTLRPRRRIFREGFVVGVTNPKNIIFFTAVLPQFVDESGAPVALQMTVLGTIYVVIALVSDSVWGFIAGTARSWFARSPRRLELLGGTGGLVMLGLGLRVAISGRRD
jgi:threonine/homoserine/homoserine lactone efflux protein